MPFSTLGIRRAIFQDSRDPAPWDLAPCTLISSGNSCCLDACVSCAFLCCPFKSALASVRFCLRTEITIQVIVSLVTSQQLLLIVLGVLSCKIFLFRFSVNKLVLLEIGACIRITDCMLFDLCELS